MLSPLADDFVTRSERDQVRKPFERDDVAVADKSLDCLSKLNDFSQNPVIVPHGHL
jgi:hypothetical protein